MSYELRLKKLRESWLEIQNLREKAKKYGDLKRKYDKMLKRVAQQIPVKLDKYNKIMV